MRGVFESSGKVVEGTAAHEGGAEHEHCGDGDGGGIAKDREHIAGGH